MRSAFLFLSCAAFTGLGAWSFRWGVLGCLHGEVKDLSSYSHAVVRRDGEPATFYLFVMLWLAGGAYLAWFGIRALWLWFDIG